MVDHLAWAYSEGYKKGHADALKAVCVNRQVDTAQPCDSSRHVSDLGMVRCAGFLGHAGDHRGGAEGRRFMWPQDAANAAPSEASPQ